MEFKNQKFDNVFINEELLASVSFEKCIFTRCTLGNFVNSMKEKFCVENITLKNCSVDTIYSIGPIDFKNILIDGLKTKRMLSVENAFFDSCVLKGKIGSLMISDYARMVRQDDDINKDVINYNNEKYTDIKWALDISDAVFTEFDCRGIPAEKIIINDDNQFKVDYNKLRSIESHPIEFERKVSIKLESRKAVKYNFVMALNKKSKFYKSDLSFVAYLKDIDCLLK